MGITQAFSKGPSKAGQTGSYLQGRALHPGLHHPKQSPNAQKQLLCFQNHSLKGDDLPENRSNSARLDCKPFSPRADSGQAFLASQASSQQRDLAAQPSLLDKKASILFGRSCGRGGSVRTYQKGLAAEGKASAFLSARGYRILATRLRTPAGEIDLIAEKEGHVILAEVKARAHLAQAATSITQRQLERIVRAGDFFLAEQALCTPKTIQIDAFFVLDDGQVIRYQNISL
jgi:putative endonuclease